VLPKYNRWRHRFTPFAACAWLRIKVSLPRDRCGLL